MDVPAIRTRRLDLVSLSPELIEALLAGRRAEAGAIAGFPLPDGWPEPGDERFLRLRLDQMRGDPASRPWLLRAMVLHRTGTMVGYINFHGPPADGAAELGYTVLPTHRRRGYAREAIRGMMRWATREHGVRRFVVSIAPDNQASLALAAGLGFRQTGSHIDPEDGLELVFELALD